MKKLKGVAAAEPSPYAVAFEDPRARFKFQSLLQDYQGLRQETDAMYRKMQLMKQRKMALLAEVRFLRRRFEHLTRNNSVHLKPSHSPVKGKARKSEPQSKQTVKKRNFAAKEASQQPIGAGVESNKKARVGNGRKAAALNSKSGFPEKACAGKGMPYQEFSPVFDLNQGDPVQLPIRSSGLVVDLNQKERSQRGKEASVRTRMPSFDLNQISKDEEELQNSTDFSGIEEARRSAHLGGREEQLNGVKLPGCRTVGNGPSRAGKRKITWQDQVALRV